MWNKNEKPNAGLEPAISRLEVARLNHWASQASLLLIYVLEHMFQKLIKTGAKVAMYTSRGILREVLIMAVYLARLNYGIHDLRPNLARRDCA